MQDIIALRLMQFYPLQGTIDRRLLTFCINKVGDY